MLDVFSKVVSLYAGFGEMGTAIGISGGDTEVVKSSIREVELKSGVESAIDLGVEPSSEEIRDIERDGLGDGDLGTIKSRRKA